MTGASRRRSPAPSATRTLWAKQDAVPCAILLTAGAVLWVIGWYNAAGEVSLDQQVVPLNLSVAGVLLATASFALWFLRGRRAIGARRRILIEARRSGLRTDAVVEVASATLAPRSHSPVLVAGDGLSRFHRSDCPLAAGRDWPRASATQHQGAGRVACGVCSP